MSHYADNGKPPRTLTRAEVARLLKASGKFATNYADHMVFALALGTGLRCAEIAALNMGDLYNDECEGRQRVTLRVFKRPPKHKGKPRPAAGPQDVFLNDTLRHKVSRLWLWKDERGHSTLKNAPVFVTMRGRIAKTTLRQRFGEWRERIGLPSTLSFHALRHTFGQRLYEETGDVLLVRRAMRHVSVTTTMIYAQPSTEMLVSAMEALPV